MKILIIGQPRLGKTTLALRIGEKYKIPVYHTDILRKDLGYGSVSTNKHIYATGIDIQEQKKFYDEIAKILPDNYVIEGSSIYPCDVLYFNPNAVVMLSAVERTLEQMFLDSRKYDAMDSYTRRRTDFELLGLFSIYKDFEENWYYKYCDIVPTVNNIEYSERLGEAEAVINAQANKEKSVFGKLFECFDLKKVPYSFENPAAIYCRAERENDMCSDELYADLQSLNYY